MQCDQIGRFFKVLGDKISNKSSRNDWQLLGNVEKPHSYVKTAADIFGLLLETFGLLFTTTSGHTVYVRATALRRCIILSGIFNNVVVVVALKCGQFRNGTIKQLKT